MCRCFLLSTVVFLLYGRLGYCATETASLSEAQLFEKIGKLEPLPKVHYSWGMWEQFKNYDERFFYQIARVTHSLCVKGEWATYDQIEKCVYACARVNKTNPKIPSTIGINYSPWHRKFKKDLPPTSRDISYYEEIEYFELRLKLIKEWINKSNKKYGTDVNVTAILLDSERFYRQQDDEKWNNAMQEALDTIHKKAVQIYPETRVEWFGRGIVRADGATFSKTIYFTGKEIMPTLSCSFYTLPEMEGMRQVFRKTCELADSYNIKEVTPWVALASGYKHDLIKKLKWTFDWDYDLIYSYMMGAELNVQWYAAQKDKYPEYDRAKVIVFYPDPFDRLSPAWGKHFIAYVRGATNVRDLSDIDFKE
jgi:hypothetical protein